MSDQKSLRDFLGLDSVSEWPHVSDEVWESPVVREYDLCERSNYKFVPNKFKKYKNMYVMYELVNGKLVGWNESPSRGWNFIVANKPKVSS